MDFLTALRLDRGAVSFHAGAHMKILATILAAVAVLSSCSTDDVQRREDQRTERYQERLDRREIRRDARQERTDAWFDRAMH